MPTPKGGPCNWSDCESTALSNGPFCEAHAALVREKTGGRTSLSAFVTWATANISISLVGSMLYDGFKGAAQSGTISAETFERVTQIISRLLAPSHETGSHDRATPGGDLRTIVSAFSGDNLDSPILAALEHSLSSAQSD